MSPRAAFRSIVRTTLLSLFALTSFGCPSDDVVQPEQPTILLSQATVSFTAEQGSTPPTPRSLDITNSKDGTLGGLHATVGYQSGATGWLAVSMSGGTAPCSLVLTVTTTSLEPGNHVAMVTVSSSVAMNSPQSVTVTYTVSEVPRPDLIVTLVSAPGSAQIGDSVYMEVELKNQGEADAGTFRLGPYYSTDQTITTEDRYSGRRCRHSDGLAAGATTRCSGYIPVPDDLSPGTYYLGAIVDDAQEVEERDEDNNTGVSNPITLESPSEGGGNIQPGEWAAATGSSTYSFEFTVNDAATAITWFKVIFSGYRCSNWSRSGSIAFGSTWTISGREISIQKTTQSPSSGATEVYKVNGTFDETGTQASGTWSLSLENGQCTSSGTWEGGPKG